MISRRNLLKAMALTPLAAAVGRVAGVPAAVHEPVRLVTYGVPWVDAASNLRDYEQAEVISAMGKAARKTLQKVAAGVLDA